MNRKTFVGIVIIVVFLLLIGASIGTNYARCSDLCGGYKFGFRGKTCFCNVENYSIVPETWRWK